MTSQEEQMLNSLVERVNSTQLSEKDPDAAKLLEKGFAGHPDAVYILAQSVLVQNIALEQARAQLTQAQEQLQQQAQQPPKATSFLGGLLHRDPKPAHPPGYQPVYTPPVEPEYQTPYQGPPQTPYQNQPYQGQPYQNVPYQGQPYGGPGYAPPYPPPPGGGFMGGGGSSFLRGAAQTAAGVAAGALAFEGVEALLHGGFGHPGMGYGMGGFGMPGIGMGMGPGMMGMGMGGFERPVEENIVTNNYYDSPGGGFEGEHEHHFRESASQNDGQLSDTSWNDNSNSGYDSSYDSGSGNDSSFGDFGSGGDTGGGGDSGGGGDLL